MRETYLLGLDQGTTGSTALVFNSKAKIVGRGYSEFEQIYPQPGWVEHNPIEIWQTTLKVAREALANAKISPSQVLGLGITNQRETTVVWDPKTGKPIHNAIVWQCRRTSQRCRELKEKGLEDLIRSKTGLVLDPYFSGSKIEWLLNNIPEARRKAEGGFLLFGTIDSWLIWNFTGGKVHATDPTNASRTMLFDLNTKKWSPELCELFKIPMKMIPEVRPSSGEFGFTEKNLFGESLPILGAAGDQQSALFGHFAVQQGQAKCTFGTGAFALSFLGKQFVPSKHGLITTITCDENGKAAYGLEGSIFMAGAIVQWLRDGLQLIQKASETESIAMSVPDTGGVVLVPAFVGMGAPHWKPDARAAFVGMTRGTKKAHLVRAALEAIAFQTVDLVHAMTQDTGIPIQDLRVDGGATSNNFLMDFLARLLGIPVKRPKMVEMTAFGAARLAAISKGLWKNSKELETSDQIFDGKFPAAEQDKKLKLWDSAIHQILNN